MNYFIFYLLILNVLALTYAKFQIPLDYNPSLRTKFIRDGTWPKMFAHYESKFGGSKIAQNLNNYFEDFYTAQINLGTPYQNLILRIDTSMADLWVMDKNKCTSVNCTGFPPLLKNYNRTLFNSDTSSTFTSYMKSFATPGLCYNGTLVNDYFQLQGLQNTRLKQDFGLCYVVDAFMGFHPYDGYLGLAWPSLSVDSTVPVFQNELASNNFNTSSFSIWLNFGNKPMGGLITWGGIDNDGTRCSPSINYVPVSSKTYWQFTLNNFIFGSYASNKNQQAISSTGNALLGFPSTTINEMMKLVNGSYHSDTGNYYASCSASFPSMRYAIGGQNYDVPWKSYVINPGYANNSCILRIFNTDGSFGPKWILGIDFIKNYCTHYDFGNGRIGFSQSFPASFL